MLLAASLLTAQTPGSKAGTGKRKSCLNLTPAAGVSEGINLVRRMLQEQRLAAPHPEPTHVQGLQNQPRERAPGGGKVQHRARWDLRRNKRLILVCAGSLSRLWL